MSSRLGTYVVIAAMAGSLAASTISHAQPAPAAPVAYTAEGKLVLPKDYRTWVYLSTGMDMAYVEGVDPKQHLFDTVFVDPASYAAFQ